MLRKRKKSAALAPTDQVQRRILRIRGQRVIIDADLAALYGVTTKRFNEQIKPIGFHTEALG